MAQVEIEPVGPEGSHKSGQEVGDHHTEGGEGILEKTLTFKITTPPKNAC